MKRSLVACVLVSLIAVASAQAALVDLRLVPEQVPMGPQDPLWPRLTVCNTFSLELWATSEPAGEVLTAVQAYIKYDDDILEVVDQAGQQASAVIPGTTLPNVIHNEVLADGLGGAIYFSAGSFAEVPTDFLVATIPFHVIKDFSDRQVCVVEEREVRNNGTLVCDTKVTLWIDDITGELSCSSLRGGTCHADPYVAPINIGETAVLDGSGSTPAAEITEYLWKICDEEVSRGSNPVVSVPWDNLPACVTGCGAYPVSLTITTSGGCEDTGVTELVVVPEPLTVGLFGIALGAVAARRKRSQS